MEAFKKSPTSHEVQSQVRQNAEIFRNTLNDLYDWEKDMKNKEKALKATTIEENNEAPPVRSLIENGIDNRKNTGAKTKEKSLPKKSQMPLNPNEVSRLQANAIKERGNTHVKLGDYEQAIYEYTSAIETFSDDPIFYSNRALCYLKMERYDECIDDCERAIEIDKLSVKAYYRRMQAMECLGRNTDALKDCTTILMIDPKNSEAKKSLDRINQRLKNVVKGPCFSSANKNIIDIQAINKPPYSRSKKPLKRVSITEVTGLKDSKNRENSNIQISDEVIDKLFNSDCGPFIEVKKSPLSPTEDENAKKDSDDISNKDSLKQRKIPASMENQKVNISLPPPPTSTAQFYSNWKELSSDQKYEYLKSIEIGNLRKILGAGFDSETLSDVIRTLRNSYIPKKDNTLMQTLLEVSKHKQNGILSLLLSIDDRKALTEIINYIKENEANAVVAAAIARNFKLNTNL